MEEKIKYYIKIILIAIIGMVIGFKTSVKEVEALTTVKTPSIISIKQYSGDRVIKNCTNTTSCDYSSDSTNLQYVQTTYDYNFTKGKRYKVKANGYYRWGSPISMNPEFKHLLDERVAFTAPYFKLETTQCYIKVTDYVVENSSNYNEVSQMTYNVEYTCEFSPEADFTSIAFMTLTDATLLTSNLTIMSSGMTVEEVVNNQDIINNANNNQGQTNQRLDKIDDTLKENTDKIINEGTFVEPEEDIQIKDSEEKEEEIYDLFDGVDINAITIDFDSTSVTKIFELLNRIITQNTIIQTMIITILSISIIKLVLGR